MYRRKDSFYQRAKAAGYRSRAAYKLLEVARRHQLIRSGECVVDLGAWPGGWLQVAAEMVGPRGRVVGVDLVAIEPLKHPVVCLRADLSDAATLERIRELAGGPADAVLSDMAPKLSGVRATDEVRAAGLAGLALVAARSLLRPGGRLLVKLFAGSESDVFVEDLKSSFAAVKLTRPQATRSGSSELYAVALGYHG